MMPHLKLDVYGVPEDLLLDEQLIHDLIDALPRVVDMQVVAGPFVYPFIHKAGEAAPEHSTIDAMSIIATSHVALHTLPHKNLCLIDVFSCKEFNAESVIALVIALFGVTREDIDVHMTERATRSVREALLSV